MKPTQRRRLQRGNASAKTLMRGPLTRLTSFSRTQRASSAASKWLCVLWKCVPQRLSAAAQSLINENTWACLSPDSRAVLCTLLPPAAFAGHRPQVGATHPGKRLQAISGVTADEPMDVDAIMGGIELDPEFIGSAYIEAALTTFQVGLNVSACTRWHC